MNFPSVQGNPNHAHFLHEIYGILVYPIGAFGAFGGCFAFSRSIVVQQHYLEVKRSCDTIISASAQPQGKPMRKREEKAEALLLVCPKVQGEQKQLSPFLAHMTSC